MKVLAAVLLLAIAGPGAAADTSAAPPQGVLGLSAGATVEVPKDLLGVVFATTREGPDAGAVQAALKQALEAALAEARKIARPGQVDVQAGNFSIYPRYAPKGGGISGWQGSAEMTVEGRDMTAIAQLTARIPSMSISRVGYSLSREAREKVEAEVTAQAIARYRAKAAEMARQFGYGGYAIREVTVSFNEPGPVPMMRAAAAPSFAESALPVEAGKGTVTATVGGTVQMK